MTQTETLIRHVAGEFCRVTEAPGYEALLTIAMIEIAKLAVAEQKLHTIQNLQAELLAAQTIAKAKY